MGVRETSMCVCDLYVCVREKAMRGCQLYVSERELYVCDRESYAIVCVCVCDRDRCARDVFKRRSHQGWA